MRPVRSILVRAPNWIGDQILAYPFFHELRAAFPGARIVSACVPWVESVQFRNLVDEVIVLPRVTRPTLMGKLEALEAAGKRVKAAGPWDLGISLPNSFSSAWQLFRAGATIRRGYVSDGRGLLLNRAVDARESVYLHRSEAYAKLLQGIVPEKSKPGRAAHEFWGIPPENELDPGVPGIIERFPIESAWPGVEQVEPPTQNYWVLAPGSTAESRRWPIERFASLARRISDETGWAGVVVGGPAEAPLASELCSDRSLKLLDRTAQGPVSGLFRIFASAKFTVGNDSGLAHVASLCGSPVFVAWGGGDPKHTRPIGPGKVKLIFSPVHCWPCERNLCSQPPGQRLACLAGIQTEAIWREIQEEIQGEIQGGRRT